MKPVSERIFDDAGLPAPYLRDTDDGREILLTGFRPRNVQATRKEQTRDVFEQMEQALHAAGCDFSHVARTWFYLDDILSWYGEFNAARSEFFQARHVFDGVMPASTGVGIAGLDVALTGAVLAMKPSNGRAEVEAVSSPLQCSAMSYQSSFSRAVEVRTSERRTVYISGTASIDDDGLTAYPESVDRQIGLTMAVVDALLVARGLDWSDVSRAVAYFPDPRNARLLAPHLAGLGMNPGALRYVDATICRADLLFEIEVDAVQPISAT
jgi:enamine deaminase RidA (YjgF/YER057c/UK114 family)